MTRLSWITGILTCLMVLLAALGSVCGAIDQIAADENFYGGMSRAAVAKYLGVAEDEQSVTAQYIGLSPDEQDVFAREMAAFMAGETDAQPEMLNEKERQHMLDVRGLTQTAANMSKSCMSLAVALAVVIAWTGAKIKRRFLPQLTGGLCAVSIIVLLAVGVMHQVSAGAFETLFVKMHEMLFTNDLWLMNPAEDILIRMMPQPLFEQALATGANQALRMLAIVLLMLLAIHCIVERMIRSHVAKGE